MVFCEGAVVGVGLLDPMVGFVGKKEGFRGRTLSALRQFVDLSTIRLVRRGWTTGRLFCPASRWVAIGGR